MAQTDKTVVDTVAPMELIDLNIDLTPNINQKFYIPEEDPADKETDISNKLRWTEVPHQRTTSPFMVAPSEESDQRTEHLDQVKFSKVYSILHKNCNSNYIFSERELTNNIIDCIKDNEVVGYIEIDGGYAYAYEGNNEVNSKEIGFFNTVGEAQVGLLDYLQLNKTSEVGLEYTTQQESPIEELESAEDMIVPEGKGISWTYYYDVPQFRQAAVKGVIKYRAKPVEIESVQFTGTEENRNELEEWFKSSSYNDYTFLEDKSGKINKLRVKTLEGNVEASIEDFIVKGIKKEFWPVKPDIFKTKYERIGESKEAKITNQVVNHNTKKPINPVNNDVTGDKAGNNVYPNEPTGQPLAPTAKIKHIDNKRVIYSEDGKKLEEKDTQAEAKKRLEQIEYFKHKQAAETLSDGVTQDELPRQNVVVYDNFLNPELAELQRKERERVKQEVKMENPIITHVPRDLKWYPIEDPNLGGKLFYQSDEATQGFMFAE